MRTLLGAKTRHDRFLAATGPDLQPLEVVKE
jgi:hypothetical protein